MSTHLYCVLPEDAPEVPGGLMGVDGGEVRALPVNGLVAWVSDVERNVPVSIDGVKAHDAVVEAALGLGATPLPARFGQRFAGD
ncbi:MAG TPA: GvpL/GvpF family gas vesicle protein, partial [Casimicrobiaceae bacterium]|nr:GvpL/GvpF family gas vesicle protein [Casimicrobiaceae bacterium]